MFSTTLICCATTLLLCGVTWVRYRRAQRQAADKLEAARRIVEVGNDAVLVADIVDGRLLQVNEASCRLLGFEREQLLRRRLPQLHPDDLVEKSALRIAEIWENKGMVYADLPLVDRDGDRIAVEVSASVVSFGSGPAVVLYARDIRPRLRQEQQIREYAAQLEQANRELHDAQAQLVQSGKMAALGNLVAGVAHELNTPLGALKANTDLARRALHQFEARVKSVPSDLHTFTRALKTLDEVCHTSAMATERMDGIVRSLRNFARLDESEEKRVGLHEGIESALALVANQLGDRIEVVKHYGSIPEVLCRPNQINQVVMNLLTNAISAIDGRGTITIATTSADEAVSIAISDTGRGIAPEHLQRIFDPGFTTKGVGVGTGLGLAICYRIVQQHHGHIAVSSELGQGATFTVTLPQR
jgi:PAS domain S-box-containing protein